MENRPLNPPEESAEDLYENAPFGYVSFLSDGTIFKINKTLLDLLGYGKKEILQVKKIQNLFRVGGKIYFETHFFPLLKMQGFIKEINFDLVRKDGSFFPALLNVNEITSPKSRIVSYRASVIDITDRKKYEKALIESKEKAERATRAKAEFLSTISHEIRTPLNAIVGIGDLIQKTSLDSTQKEYARILKLSSQSLLELVNNLLDLSKLDARKVKLEKRVFSFHDVLEVLIHSFKIKAAEKNIQLQTEFSDNLPDYLIGDPVKLTQVLTNLLGNAIKFTPEGYVNLEAKILESPEKKVVLRFSVYDTGIGIPKDKLDIIFHEFSQASYDVTLEFGGTGLGLTISQKLLQMHGSELEVESEEGKGSKFSFTIAYDLSDRAPAKKDGPPLQKAVSKFGAKVLVVDDSPTNLFIISQYLKEWKLEHTTVLSGPAAIDAVRQEHYDIILMDLHMPKMNGYEASSRIRELAPDVDPVIIALSASGRGDINLKMQRAGISAYVPKPFDPIELQEVMTDFLSERSKRKPAGAGKLSGSDPGEPLSGQPATEYSKRSFDISRLIQLSANNPEILNRLISNSLKSLINYRDGFTSAADMADHKKLEELIHKNTMTLHYIQAEKLVEITEKFKERLRPTERTKVDLTREKLEVLAEFEKVITGLESLRSENFS